jgi:hypothetical protein
VFGLTVFDDRSGPALYAGGSFTTAGGVTAYCIAKWDGVQWAPLGSGVGGTPLPYVSALTAFDDGNGPALYAGGHFTGAGGVEAHSIAKWDGAQWSPLGSGVGGGTSFYPLVNALTVFDDGTGPALYAGGNFTTAGGVAANYIAKWNGHQWSPLGSGVGGVVSDPPVLGLTVFDDGTGAALYAGGQFTTAGGVAANYIAKWDGTQWTPLGSGMNNQVNALTVFDDGSGPALYAGGRFITAGGVEVDNIAKWDGVQWVKLGSGMNNGVAALTVFDDGSGPALYAGGGFTMAGDMPANNIAKWDGHQWSPLGSGMNNQVNALTVFDDGTGPALYAGGFFTTAGGVTVNYIAAWRCVMP